ncbi:MAG: hypothetical protein MUP76_08770 [Acidimicrobiia bacterium]|nr:hypothetical protein [Acidimicrobiia bacterium]
MRDKRRLIRMTALAAVLLSLTLGQTAAFGETRQLGLQLSVEIGGISAAVPGPRISEGTPITFVFTATNTGSEPLSGLALTDSRLGPVDCAATSLAAGQSTVCEIAAEARRGLFRSTAVTSASAGDGSLVEASLRVGYRGLALKWIAAVDLDILVNGMQADAPGPVLATGSAVAFTYRVTNVGTVPLKRLKVSDSRRAVTCPSRTLDPGQTVECAAFDTVVDGRLKGRAVAGAWDERGEQAAAAQRFSYRGERQSLRAEFEAVALAGGLPASEAPGPMVRADRSIAWAIEVVNTGDDELWGLYARDLDRGRMTCESLHLAPGEHTRCTVWGWAIGGPMVGEIEVSAWASDERHLTTVATRHAFGYRPGADLLIETYVDGFDADTHAGPRRALGSTVSLTYRVHNIGTVDLTRIKVSDALFGSITCPSSRIRAGESMECSTTTIAELGWWETAGTVRGYDGVKWVRDSDKTFWHVRTVARVSVIDLRVTIGGLDAANAPGPKLIIGDRIAVVYRATNAGNSPLWSMEIRDPNVPASAMTCGESSYVLPGDVVTCRATFVVESGKQVGGIEAVAWNSDGTRIVGTDTIYYVGRPGPT